MIGEKTMLTELGVCQPRHFSKNFKHSKFQNIFRNIQITMFLSALTIWLIFQTWFAWKNKQNKNCVLNIQKCFEVLRKMFVAEKGPKLDSFLNLNV